MSARGTKTLSRLFQATLRTKRNSGAVQDLIPIFYDDGFAFEPDPTSQEHEKIRDYHSKLVFKDGEFLDMELLDEKRRLLYVGTLFRQTDSAFERRGQVQILVLLFDNYLVMAKPVGKIPDTKFQVSKRPIPLDLLTLEPYGDVPSRAKRRSSLFLGRDDHMKPYLSTPSAQNIADNHRGMFPFTITHEGRFASSYTLCVGTEETRSMWRSKLEEAIRAREKSSTVFKLKILNRGSFLMKTGVPSIYLPQNRQLTRTINSLTPFTTRDGRNLTAVGCLEGLWVGDIRDSQSFHRILPLQMIRQCAVLETFGIILILTDNDLCAYDLESCVPTSEDPGTNHPPQKLNSKGEVSSFTVGMIDGNTYVVFWKRKRTDTVFRMLRVVRSLEQSPVVTSPDAKEEWFCLNRDFLLPVHCTDVIFVSRSLAILHRNGFGMFNPQDCHCVDMPLPADRNFEHKGLIKRCMSSQSLGMIRFEAESFLLCYDKFGVYINKHGVLINGRPTIEWEGVAQGVSYHHPYIFLFSSGFMEVRNAISGRLEQIIRGDAMQCIWEGNDGLGRDPGTGQPTQDPSFIGITNTPAGLDELAVQCIFTLVPSKRSPSPTQMQPSLPVAERARL